MSPIIRRRSLLLAALSIVLLVLSSCGAPGPLTVTMTEYAFKLSQPSAKSGKVTFRIVNTGSIVHEMVVVQTDVAADKLPKGADGDVDEDKVTAIGEQGDIDAGKSVDLPSISLLVVICSSAICPVIFSRACIPTSL